MKVSETRICEIVERVLTAKLDELTKDEPEHYTAEEVAAIMGVEVQLIRRLCKQDEIESVKQGKEITIKRASFLVWLDGLRSA